MKLRLIKSVICLFVALFLFCVTNSADNTGTGHDGEMKVIGTVQTVNGAAVEGLDVRILPVTFNPLLDTLDSLLNATFTLSDGSYEFVISDSGYYTISAYHKASNSYLYLDSLYINEALEDQGIDTLKTATTLTVISLLSDSSNNANGVILYIEGTDLILDTLTTDSSEILIPSNKIELNVVSNDASNSLLSKGNITPIDTSENVYIISDSTDEIIPGDIELRASGFTDSIWNTNAGDTLTIILFYVDSLNDSVEISDYSINLNYGVDTLWNKLDSNSYLFTPSDTTTSYILKGRVNLLIDNQSFTIYSNPIQIIVSDSVKDDYWINFTGKDTAFSFDTAAYLIKSNLDTLDSVEVTYFRYLKAPSDTSFEVPQYPILNLFDCYFEEVGKYELFVKAEAYNLKYSDSAFDTLTLYSDTLIITVIGDTIFNDSIYPELPDKPTGSDIITINSSRYYVTDESEYFDGGDTLYYEYRFTWNDTITDSTYSPNGDLPDASNWDTLPYAQKSWSMPGIYFVRVQRRFIDYPNKMSDWSAPTYVKVFNSINNSLIDTAYFNVPNDPVGDDTVAVNQDGTFITSGASCVIPGNIEYRFDWGDGTYSNWSSNAFAQKQWSSEGDYEIRAQARSSVDTAAVSQWSGSLPVLVNLTGRNRF